VISPETRMMGLPYGEEIVIVGRTMWTQCTSVTDGRTDGQTDRITITKTVQRIASHGKNVIKTRFHRKIKKTFINVYYNYGFRGRRSEWRYLRFDKIQDGG